MPDSSGPRFSLAVHFASARHRVLSVAIWQEKTAMVFKPLVTSQKFSNLLLNVHTVDVVWPCNSITVGFFPVLTGLSSR